MKQKLKSWYLVKGCDCNLFDKAYKYNGNEAKKTLFNILEETRNIGMTPLNVALQLFDCLVLSSILEYGSKIWFCNKDILELEKFTQHIGSPLQLEQFYRILRRDSKLFIYFFFFT